MPGTCAVKREIAAMEETLKTLEKDQQQIKNLIQNHPEDNISPTFYGIGNNIFRSLYGTLTVEDAKFYENQIEMLKNDTRPMVALIANHSILIKSEYDEQRIKLNDFSELSLYKFGNVSNAMKLLSSDLTDVQYNEILNDIAMTLENNIDLNRVDTAIIINAIFFAKQGELHPRFLSEYQITESLVDIHKRPGHELPLPHKNQFAAELLQLSELTIYQSGGKLIYIIAVPLLDREWYTLYKNIPLPIYQQSNLREKNFAYLKPNSPFTAMSGFDGFYYRLDDNELNDCKKTGKRFICKNLNGLYQIDDHSDCEVKLITQLEFQDFSTCDIRVRSSAHTYWSRVHRTNQWVFSSATSETMHITCDDSERQTLNINGTGILYLRPRCVASTSSIVLASFDEISTTISTKFVSRQNFNIAAVKTTACKCTQR